MNKGIILTLAAVAVIGMLALYALRQGPALVLKPPPQQRIAFISDRSGNPDIWTMKTDGSDARQVTNDSADDQIPSWSPDAKQLVSVCDRLNQTYQVFISAWDGRYVRCLTSSEATKDVPTWSTDGREITFISGGKVCGIKSSGGREDQYLPVGMPSTTMVESVRFAFGAWSHGNQYLFYVRETDRGKEVYAADKDALASAGEEDATQEAKSAGEAKPVGVGITMARNLSVAVAPRSARIAVSFIDRVGRNGILIGDLGAVTTQDVYLFPDNKHSAGKLAWSPDEKRIAYELWTTEDNTQNTPLGIYTIKATGGKPQLIMKGDAREPTWSPDGRQLACTFMSANDKRDIWRVNADGTGAINLTKGRGDSYNPAWSPR